MNGGIDEDITSTEASWFGGRVPIVIGVAGHRTLGASETAIADSAAAEFHSLKKNYPNTPFIVLSGLAEGADRLLVKIAFRELGAKLFAILPLPGEEYKKDFATEASRKEFDALLSSAAGRVEVFDLNDKELWNTPGEPRNEQYARAGGIVAEQSQILFAVWDGKPARGTGGTAHVVEWFKHGRPPKQFSGFPNDISPLDPAEPGQLIHIDSVTGAIRPISGPNSDLSGKLAERVTPGKGKGFAGSRKSNIHQIFKLTERFNHEVAAYKGAPIGQWPLLPSEKTPQNTPLNAAAVFMSADGLAVSLSKVVRASDVVLYSTALVAVFFFNMLNNWPVAPGAYLAAVGLIFAGALCLRAWSFDNRFLEYRGLAEAMRVLFFWRLCGIRKPVWLCYLSKHSGVARWVRHAVRALEFCEDSTSPKVPANALELTKAYWLKDQIAYYGKAGERHWLHYKRWIVVAENAFRLSFLLALVFFAFSLISWKNWMEWSEAELSIPAIGSAKITSLAEWLQIALGLLAAASLAARAFLSRRADFEIAKQFFSARQRFELALENLEKAEAQAAKPDWSREEILEKLGREALLEQAEWLWIRHSRPFEMPN